MTKLAPVLSAHWDDKDSFTLEGYKRHGGYTASAKELVDSMRAGNPKPPTRGPSRLVTYKEASAVLAGLNDGLAHEGVQAGEPTLLGLKLSKEGK